MSALAGLWRVDGNPEVEAVCRRMLSAQEVYGPHDERQWSDGTVTMGRRLFRTLPEDAQDRQPLRSADGRLTLVADVRLDNREELISALGLPSEADGQLCDAAVLLECLISWQEGALDRLVGDFAFALWNAGAQRLLLARDFLGQRPLHYHRGRGFFAFASMPKGLHAVAEIPYGADEQAVAEFITLMPQTGPRSFFKDINRVEAGHLVTVTRDGVWPRRYWNPRPSHRTRKSPDDYIEGLRHHLDQATRSRLRGVNGVAGAELSSGFDSSSVTATAARLLAPTGGKVLAFTAVPRDGYDGPWQPNRTGDEGPLARATAAMYPNIEHVLVRSGHLSPMDAVDRDFVLFERPIQNLCNRLWGRAIEQAARQRGISVLLTGQMGNLTVSYNGLELLPEMWRAGRMITLWREAAGLVRNRYVGWRGILAKTLGPYSPVWLWQWAHKTLTDGGKDVQHYTAINAKCVVRLDLHRRAQERDHSFSYRPARNGLAARLWVMSRIDTGYYNKGTLANSGIDHRDPTADKRLVEYCLSVPIEHYLAGGVPRALAIRALADRLPRAVLDERKKGYQASDWHESLSNARSAIAAELNRLASCESAARTLDLARLNKLVENWPLSGWARSEVVEPYRHALLRGISAGHFLRMAGESHR